MKSNIGHLESAAGIAGLTKVILQLTHRTLVPSLHAETANSKIALEGSPFFVQKNREARHGQSPRRASISAFGSGCYIAHMIV